MMILKDWLAMPENQIFEIDSRRNVTRDFYARKWGTTRQYVDALCCGMRRPGKVLARKIHEETRGVVSMMELFFAPIPRTDFRRKKDRRALAAA